MAVLLALGSAVAYGAADFVGGLTSRRAGASWPVAVLVLLSGGTLVLVVGLAAPGRPSGADLGWGAVSGLAGGVGTAFLYRGLAAGRMGVVAPVSGVGAAVVPVAVGVLLAAERPAPLVWVGVLAALPGIWLVSRATDGVPVDRASVLDGVLAGTGFGVLFAALAEVGDDAGLLPLAVNHYASAVTVAVVATALGQRWGRGRGGGARRERHRPLPGLQPRWRPQRGGGGRLALPGLHGAARARTAARARGPRPGRGARAVRPRGGPGRGGLSQTSRR